jgi:hypothetical protein
VLEFLFGKPFSLEYQKHASRHWILELSLSRGKSLHLTKLGHYQTFGSLRILSTTDNDHLALLGSGGIGAIAAHDTNF